MNLHAKKAFTLMEVIIACIIASTIAVMALTNYTKTIRVAHMEDDIRQLTLLHGANQVYKAKNGRYWPNDGAAHTSIAEINAALGINLPTSNFTVYFFNGDGNSWTIEFHSSDSPMFFVAASDAPIDANNPRCNYNCP